MGDDKLFQTNLDYYRTFYHVVKSGSISLAANRLSLSQPTVTKAVQRLEENLKCKLLQRTHNGVALTAEGEVLWKQLEPACKMILDAERELRLFRKLDKGIINIASYESGVQIYILPAVREFIKANPNIQVNLMTRKPEEMFSLLASGLIDAALVFTPVALEDMFETRLIDEFEDSLIVGRDYAFLAQEERSLEELAQYPFITYSSSQSLRAFLREYFQKYGLSFEPKIEVGSQPLMIQAVCDGLGIGSVPHRAISKQLADGTLFRLRLKEAMPIRQVLSVTNRNCSPGRPAQVFLDEYLPRFGEFELI